MDELSQKWMAYIDAEVRAACRRRGLAYHVRRKWTVREKPVSASPVDDYEWKLVADAQGDLSEPLPDYEEDNAWGRYYLLQLDRAQAKFILLHDTRGGGDGSEMNLATFTEIRLLDRNNPDFIRIWRETHDDVEAARVAPPPPSGWLYKTLVLLTERFQPNWFTIS